jgi:hypothetical protein
MNHRHYRRTLSDSVEEFGQLKKDSLDKREYSYDEVVASAARAAYLRGEKHVRAFVPLQALGKGGAAWSKPGSKTIKLEHYSPQSGIRIIDPAHHGKRRIGAEVKRAPLENKLAFYYEAGSKPEDLVASGAKSRYTIELDPSKHRIYDMAKDPDGLVSHAVKQNGGAWNTDLVLGQIKRAGYYGFQNKASGVPNAVALFYPHPVASEEAYRHVGKTEACSPTLIKRSKIQEGPQRRSYFPIDMLEDPAEYSSVLDAQARSHMRDIEQAGKRFNLQGQAIRRETPDTKIAARESVGPKEYFSRKLPQLKRAALTKSRKLTPHRLKRMVQASISKLPAPTLKPHQIPEKGVHLSPYVGSKGHEGTSEMGKRVRSAHGYFNSKYNAWPAKARSELAGAKLMSRRNLAAIRSMKAPILKAESYFKSLASYLNL